MPEINGQEVLLYLSFTKVWITVSSWGMNGWDPHDNDLISGDMEYPKEIFSINFLGSNKFFQKDHFQKYIFRLSGK